MTPCHCGSPGLYNGECYRHAKGLSHARRARAKRGAKTTQRRRLTSPEGVRLCRNRLHAMTPENRRQDRRGGCLACRRENERRNRGEALVVKVVPVRRRAARPIILPRATAAYQQAMAEAVATFRTWEASPERRTLHWARNREGYYV